MKEKPFYVGEKLKILFLAGIHLNQTEEFSTVDDPSTAHPSLTHRRGMAAASLHFRCRELTQLWFV